ncbi:hypothetical protein cypCar_00043520 [Cyprinus carpio]|nr:hypothetical protein cypCar_00043520 [Cyprinus carpio]
MHRSAKPLPYAPVPIGSPAGSLSTDVELWVTPEQEKLSEDVPDSNLLSQNEAVYHLVNTSFSFEQAQRYCRGQSSTLTTSGVKEDEEGARQILSKSNLKGPVWFETNRKQSGTPHLPLPKQKTILRGLSFTSKDGYARVHASFPALSAVSVCARLQWDPRHKNVSTVFSYAAPVFVNEFQLRGQIDEPKRNHERKVRLALLIQGKHHPYKAELPIDEDWHQVCVTWRSSDGFWAIYVDGKMGDSGKGETRGNAKDIHGDGIFILGQDQDSFGGTLTEPFFGNLTDLNVWGEALEHQNVTEMNTCSQLTNHRAVFRWQDWNLTVHQSVQNLSATLKCPGSLKTTKTQEKECEVFNGWSDGQPQYSTAPCTHTLPFICRMSKGLCERQHTADNVLSDTVDEQSWASVSRLLNVSEQVVLKEQKQLEDRDMLFLMHVLSRAADLPSTANHSQRDVERLGQSFITIADSLISQDNASKWNNIKEVVKGPMAVIQTVDRMVSNLNFLLKDDTDSVQIHSDKIKLQVRQKLLSEGSHVSAFCGPDAGNRDCISVPAENMKELQNNGFQKVTLLNTWYSSVNCLSEREENITLSPIVSDGSHRHLRTVLGSSVISSTVLADGQPISMSVNFTLQHRIQRNEDETGLQIISLIGSAFQSQIGLQFTKT